MVVERVHHAGPQLVDFAGREILDRAGALEDEHGLEMVLIVHRQFLAGEHRRDVEREAHIVVLEQQAGADPAVRPDVAVGFADVAEIADKHGNYLLFWVGGAYSAATAKSSAIASRSLVSRMSSPCASKASSMTSGARILMTSPWGPLVSIISPASKQAVVTASASSPEPTLMPRIMPRPRVSKPWSRAIASRRAAIRSPRRAISSSNALSLQKWRSAAVAVTKAWLLPRKVPLCSPGDHRSSSGRNRVSAKGSPMPESDLAWVTMSGVKPMVSKLKKGPVRPQPAWMSSTISNAPCAFASPAMRRSHAGDATLSPPSPCTVSTRLAAGASTPLHGSARRLSRSVAVSSPAPH